ncbi:MAG: 30S ribosomal protein S6 [Mycoplasmoidaceae bacterium]
MPKYEAMIIIDGGLSEPEQKSSIKDIINYLSLIKNVDISDLGHKKLAYLINKKSSGYYYVLNFNCDDASIIAEFRRLIILNKNVIRFIIINLEKDYGYAATQNPKKIAKSNLRKEIYSKLTSKIDDEKERILKLKDDVPVKLTDI